MNPFAILSHEIDRSDMK